jgi:hypothetical protein
VKIFYEIGRRITPEEVYHDWKLFKNGKNLKKSAFYKKSQILPKLTKILPHLGVIVKV